MQDRLGRFTSKMQHDGWDFTVKVADTTRRQLPKARACD